MIRYLERKPIDNGIRRVVNRSEISPALCVKLCGSLRLKNTLIGYILLILWILSPDAAYCQPQNALDSAIIELESMSNTPDKVNHLIEISNGLGESNPSSAMNYASLALELAREINDRRGEAASLRRKATLYNFSGEFENCIAANLEALAINEIRGDLKGVALSYSDLGLVYNMRGQNEEALKYFEKALAIRLKLDDRKEVAASLGNIGSTNRKLRKFDEALNFFNRGLVIAKEENYNHLIEAFLNNMGNVYGDMGDYPKSLDYFNQFLQLKEEQGEKRSIAICLSNIGGLYNKIGNYKVALTYFERSLALAAEMEFTVLQRHIYQNVALTYQELGDSEKAFKYLRDYITLNDSLMSDKNNKTIEELRAKYEFEKKERELVEKDAKILQGEEAARRQDQMIYGVIAVLILSIVFTALLYNRFRITRQQKQIIESQKAIVDEKNKDITDSINYAKRIQTAMLRSDEEMSSLLGEHFVLFLPKDVVSGDFYWCHQQADEVIWVLADCTGHGVPGAFMSMIGNSLMNEIIIEKKLGNPGLILDALKAGIIKSLGVGSLDGMDMSLCSLNRKTNELQFAGANNGVYIIRKGIGSTKLSKNEGIVIFNDNLIELRPDKQAVGYEEGRENLFTTRSVNLEKGDNIYASSDGYVDQFGGRSNKKLSARRFKAALSEFYSTPMTEQKEQVSNLLKDWQGDKEQIDDICVIGVTV